MVKLSTTPLLAFMANIFHPLINVLSHNVFPVNCARNTKSLPGGYSMIEKQGSTVMVLRNNIDKIR